MKKLKLGNSRLLYVEQKTAEADIAFATGFIDSFIAASPQVELAREKIFVYPRKGTIWVGREIAGHPGALGEDLKYEDFDGLEIWETKLGTVADSFCRLLDEAKSESLKQGRKLYRLQMDLDNFCAPILHMT